MARFYLAPGVYPEELDLSGRVQAIAASIGAIVIKSAKGPLAPTFITNGQQFIDLYGQPNPRWGFGHHSALAFLNVANALWVKRVVKAPHASDSSIQGARHAGLVVMNDKVGSYGTNTYFWPFNSGRYSGYSEGTQQVINLIFSGATTSGNVVVTVGDSPDSGEGNEITVTQAFTTNSDNTLQLVANALQTQINTTWGSALNKNIGSVSVIKTGATNSDDRIIRIVAPEDQVLYVKAATAVGVTISAETNPWLFEVYAENPGSWGNDIGIKLMNVDQGQRQRLKMTFSSAVLTGQTINMAIDIKGQRIQVDPVSFATDNDTTLAELRTQILNAFNTNGYTNLADVLVVNSGANDRELEITAPIDGPSIFTITAEVTGAGTLPAITVTEVIAGIDKDDTFEIHVYKRDNVFSPVEKHKVSFIKQIDGFGQQLQIEDVINVSGSRSDFVRVAYNGANGSALLKNIPSQGSAIYWLNGGSDGDYPDSTDVKVGWAAFEDRAKIAVRILINGGEWGPSVQNEMIRIAEKRRDCFAIVDMPPHMQRAQDAISHRSGSLGFNPNSSFAALYTPDLKIVDDFTNETMYVPPSGYVAAQFAENDNKAAEWFAPAGLNRGLIKSIIGLREEYSQGEMEQLFPKQINFILKKPGKGYPIWGAETLQAKASALSNINVRRLLITIEVSLVDALDYTIYEPHDPITQFEVVQLCTNFLQPIKEGRGLYDYKVISDGSNNKHYHRDMGQLNVDLILKPVIPVKFIRLRSVITKAGAAFEEILGLLETGSALG